MAYVLGISLILSWGLFRFPGVGRRRLWLSGSRCITIGLSASVPRTPAQTRQTLLSPFDPKLLTVLIATLWVCRSDGVAVLHRNLRIRWGLPWRVWQFIRLTIQKWLPSLVPLSRSPSMPRPKEFVTFPLVASIRQVWWRLLLLSRCLRKNGRIGLLGRRGMIWETALSTWAKQGRMPRQPPCVPCSPEEETRHTVPATPWALRTSLTCLPSSPSDVTISVLSAGSLRA